MLGPSGGSVTTCGLSGSIAFLNGWLALGGFTVGGIPTTGTHSSLMIGTPTSLVATGFGGGSVSDIGTVSFAANTYSGTRSGIRYTGLTREFRVDGSSGQNNPGTAALFINGSGNVGIGTTTPAASLEVAGGNVLFRNPLSSGAYFLFQGDATNRQSLYHISDGQNGNPVRILTARATVQPTGGGSWGCIILGNEGASGFAGCEGTRGHVAISGQYLTTSGFTVGGVPASGSHSSLVIGTRDSSPVAGFGGYVPPGVYGGQYHNTADLGTITFTNGSYSGDGLRSAMRYTGFSHEFRVDASTGGGQNNPGTTALFIDQSANVNIANPLSSTSYFSWRATRPTGSPFTISLIATAI